ncbi:MULTISPECIES: caspase family protein [Nocardia]|uniref:caspase family protein n=2 Tax=Nocardia TaxID=1817 RepID=UPI0024584055|nr:caspase family protein [Nocardia abscessus]
MRLPDGLRSRAVLIGTSNYDDVALPGLPAVARNVPDLADILTSDHGFGLPARNCESIVDATDTRDVLSAVLSAADEAEDLLLVYYAGHGLLDPRHRLFLSLTNSPRTLDKFWLAIDIDDIRNIMTKSPARNRVLILDCCFSGRAFEAMGSGAAESVIATMDVSGTYTLTSTSENQIAHAPEGEQYTAFTGALIDLLDNGAPDGPEYLTLDTIYEHMRRALVERRASEPKRKCVDSTGELALMRNRAWYNDSTDGSVRAATPGARFHELSAHPAYPMIRRLVGWYISECIPDADANQRDRWNVTALPSTNQPNGRRLLTMNCGGQEVVFISEVTRPNGSRQVVVVCNIAAPPDRTTLDLHFTSESVRGQPMTYQQPVWAWQFNLVDDLSTLHAPITTPEFISLARQLNGELMKSKSRYARFHNADLAEDLLAVAAHLADENRLPFDSLHLVVARTDIESGDIEPTLRVLQRLLSSTEHARDAQGILDLRIDGYNDTGDELFEIESVRAFIYALDEHFPYWLFFSSTHTSSLQMIALCFLPPFLTAEGKKRHFPPRLAQLLTNRWIPALNDVAAYAGLDDAQLRARSDEALGYFAGPRTELPF